VYPSAHTSQLLPAQFEPHEHTASPETLVVHVPSGRVQVGMSMQPQVLGVHAFFTQSLGEPDGVV
jgi:hypothetical protein